MQTQTQPDTALRLWTLMRLMTAWEVASSAKNIFQFCRRDIDDRNTLMLTRGNSHEVHMTLGPSVTTAPKGGEWLSNASQNLTATGSTQGTALAIPAGQDLSIVTTTATGTGVVLPSAGVSRSEEYVVANHGANALLVYPPSGGQIGTLGANAGYSLAAGKTGYFICCASLGKQWTANP